ncbi:HD domain-containing protein [Kitasatospora sp. NPDC002227]|uniref:HD domain-containing protein n=1 Tax=Kitasatospora sp. NPDC002227 TaxID=3154773 RepID=UPI00331814CA
MKNITATATGQTRGPELEPLPGRVVQLLERAAAPLRLVAHLRAVHDVASQLTEWVAAQCPGLEMDREAVLFGAATHDIGKALHPAELSGPGSEHEVAGRELLLGYGVPAELARFAEGHARWGGTGIEDLLVSLADKVWKGKRVPELEELVVAELVRCSGRPEWEEFLRLDDLLGRIGEGADERLAYQGAHPV